jgi:hypothetical protein
MGLLIQIKKIVDRVCYILDSEGLRSSMSCLNLAKILFLNNLAVKY